MQAADAVKRRARCVFLNFLSFVKKINYKSSKRGAEDLRTKHKAIAKPHTPPLAAAKRKPVTMLRAATTPTPTPRGRLPLFSTISAAAAAEEDDSMDEESDEEGVRRPFEGLFGIRMPPPKRCSHCYEEGCPGCACMCAESTEWIEHEGGHFFSTCEKCGGHECPGCMCVCSNSTVLVEHGGHAHKKYRIFNSQDV